VIEMDNKTNIFKKLLKSRSMKHGSNSIIMIVVVIAIAVLVNFLIGMADLKLDLTSNKLFSLSDVTKNELKGLKQDVTIIGLFDDGKVGSGTEYKEVTDILGLYQKNAHIKVQYVDPDKNPGIIKQLDEQNTMDLQKNDFVVKSTVNGKEKKKKLGYYDLFQTQTDQQTFQTYNIGSNAEQGFTGAIRFVVSEKTPVVYFTEGHNEISLSSSYTTVKQYLEKNNYEVKTLPLLSTGKIPDDASLLVVASPKSDLTTSEKGTVQDYLDKGGKAIFMFDYLSNDPDFTQFNSLLSDFNVAVDYDKVKENDSNRTYPGDQYTIVMDVNTNSIMPQAFNVLLGNSRSISILKNTKEYITTTPLMVTSSTAIGEAINKSRGENIPGPLNTAVAVENKGNADISKIIVMGNAEFISDSAAQTYGSVYNYGVALFLQSVSWLTDKKDDIIAPTKSYDANKITVTGMQSTALGVVVIIILPLVILSTGVLVYLRRRHL
jgi:ABC-2 type transport system permease protein